MHRTPSHRFAHSLIYLATVLTVVGVGFFLSAPAACEDAAAATVGEQAFGSALELEETVPIAAILADPAGYQGRRVRVEGRVREVCPKKGCWMDLVPAEAATGGAESLRIKVEDDVIVFPQDAVGATAVAEGTVEVVEMDRERYVAWMAHQAEERGEAFDPETIGQGPFLWVQVKGAGARLSRR